MKDANQPGDHYSLTVYQEWVFLVPCPDTLYWAGTHTSQLLSVGCYWLTAAPFLLNNYLLGRATRPGGCLPSPPLLATANAWQPAYKRSAPWPPFMFQHAAASPHLSPHPCLTVSAVSSLLSSLPFSWELSLSRLLLQESLSQTWLLQNPN